MKRMMSFFLAIVMFTSLIALIPVNRVSAAETISDETLFMKYPAYLSNSNMQQGLNQASNAYYAVINSYSKTDETVAALMTSMSDGFSVLIKEGLSKLGIGQNFYETQAKKAAKAYMQTMLSDETVIKKATGIVDKAYKTLKTSYSVASNVDKTTMMADLVKIAKQSDISIKSKDIDDLVDDLYDAKSIKNDLAAIGEANKLWKIVFEFTELHAIEMTTMDLLMDELVKSGQKNSDLYLGLSLLKKDIEKDAASYVLKYYATDTAISFLADQADELLGVLTSANAVALVTTCMEFFADYIYVDAKADDITQAIMQTSFVSSIDICLSQYRVKFLQGKGTKKDIETYENLYGAYLCAYKAVLDTCYDVSKLSDKFSLGGDCLVCRDALEYTYTYSNYMKWCKEAALSKAPANSGNTPGSSGGGFSGNGNQQQTPQSGQTVSPKISLSKSQINLDLESKKSDTVNITLSGTLPGRYHLDFDCSSPVQISWGGWTNNSKSNSVTVTATENTQNGSTATIFLRDDDGNTYATKTFSISVTLPKKEPPRLQLSETSFRIDHVKNPVVKVTASVSGTLPDGCQLSADHGSAVTTKWSKYENNSVVLTITANHRLGDDDETITVYLMDDNKNILDTKTIKLHSTTNKWTITFDANGGINGPTDMVKYAGALCEVPYWRPVREGYQFAGWATSKYSDKVVYDCGDEIVENRDITLYAVWTDKYAFSPLKLQFDKFISDTSEEKVLRYRFITHDWVEEATDLISDIVITSDDNTENEWWLVETDGEICLNVSVKRAGNQKTNDITITIIDNNDDDLFEENITVNWPEKEVSHTNTNDIMVFVNGKKLGFDVPPKMINNRTMVPMRAIFESLGAEVSWDGNTQTAYGKTNDTVIEISIGKAYLLKNGEYVALDSPAVIVNNRTLVPVRAIAESLNCQVEWVGSARSVHINSLPDDFEEVTFEPADSSAVQCEFSDFKVKLDTSWGDDELFWSFQYVCNVDTEKCGVEIWNKRTKKQIAYDKLTNPAYREIFVNENQFGGFSTCIGSIGSSGETYTLKLGETYEWMAYVYDTQGNKYCSDIQEYTFTGKGSRFLDK